MIKTEFGIIDQTFRLGDGIEDCIVTRDGRIRNIGWSFFVIFILVLFLFM